MATEIHTFSYFLADQIAEPENAQMWPYTGNLGVQLTYGINGNPYCIPEEDDFASDSSGEEAAQRLDQNAYSIDGNNPWKFPKASLSSDHGSKLFKVRFSSKRLVTANRRGPAADCEANIHHYNDKNLAIPSQVLGQLTNESKNWNSNYIFDPTMDKVMDTTQLRYMHTELFIRVIGFVSGDIGSILNLSAVKDKTEIIYGTGVVDSQPKQTRLAFDVPLLNKPVTVDIGNVIKQVEFSKPADPLTARSHLMAVRTDLEVFVFKIAVSRKTQRIKLELVGSLQAAKHTKESFADVSFNCWNYTQFATVDIKGNWQVWQIKPGRSGTIVESGASGQIDEPTELSNWKKLIWGSDVDELFFFNRSGFYKIMLNSDNKTSSTMKVYAEKKQVKILQVERCVDKCEEIFLLTSTDILWLKFDASQKLFSHILSWKHYLNPEDVSLRFSLNAIGDYAKGDRKYMLAVHSQIHSSKFFYQFGFDKQLGLHRILNDPIFIKLKTDTIIRNTFLLPVHFLSAEEELRRNRLKYKVKPSLSRKKFLSSEFVAIDDDDTDDDDNDNQHNDENTKESTKKLPSEVTCNHVYFAVFQISTSYEINRTLISSNSNAVIYRYRKAELEDDDTEAIEKRFFEKTITDNIVVNTATLPKYDFLRMMADVGNVGSVQKVHNQLISCSSSRIKTGANKDAKLGDFSEYQRLILTLTLKEIYDVDIQNEDINLNGIEQLHKILNKSVTLREEPGDKKLTKIAKNCAFMFLDDLIKFLKTDICKFPFKFPDSRSQRNEFDQLMFELTDEDTDFQELNTAEEGTGVILKNFKPEKVHPRMRFILQDWNELASDSPTDWEIPQVQTQYLAQSQLYDPSQSMYSQQFMNDTIADSQASQQYFGPVPVISTAPSFTSNSQKSSKKKRKLKAGLSVSQPAFMSTMSAGAGEGTSSKLQQPPLGISLSQGAVRAPTRKKKKKRGGFA